MTPISRIIKLFIAISLLAFGGVLYLACRPQDLLIYRIAEDIGLSEMSNYLRKIAFQLNPSPWIVNSLPDGIFIFSFLLINYSLYRNKIEIIYNLFLFCFPIIFIASEYMQKYGIVKGVYDPTDVYFYTIPFFIFLFLKIIDMSKNNSNPPAEFLFIFMFIIWTIELCTTSTTEKAGTKHETDYAWLFGGYAVIIVLYALFYFLYRRPQQQRNKIEQQKKKKQTEEYLAQRNQHLQEIEKQLNEKKEEIGGAEIEIKYSDEDYFLANEKEHKVVLNMNVYDFKEIISFEVKDHSRVVTNSFTKPGTATTSTNTGSMLGRAVVGGVLTGGVGAVIGGATASKTTTIEAGETTTTSTTTHNYQIIVTVDRMTNPVERLLLGGNSKSTEHISSILLLITNRNNPPAETKGTSSISISEELFKLAELKEKGLLSEEEFQTQKQRILNS